MPPYHVLFHVVRHSFFSSESGFPPVVLVIELYFQKETCWIKTVLSFNQNVRSIDHPAILRLHHNENKKEKFMGEDGCLIMHQTTDFQTLHIVFIIRSDSHVQRVLSSLPNKGGVFIIMSHFIYPRYFM